MYGKILINTILLQGKVLWKLAVTSKTMVAEVERRVSMTAKHAWAAHELGRCHAMQVRIVTTHRVCQRMGAHPTHTHASSKTIGPRRRRSKYMRIRSNGTILRKSWYVSHLPSIPGGKNPPIALRFFLDLVESFRLRVWMFSFFKAVGRDTWGRQKLFSVNFSSVQLVYLHCAVCDKDHMHYTRARR